MRADGVGAQPAGQWANLPGVAPPGPVDALQRQIWALALALNNAQGELSPLEVGLHALGSELTGRDYAKQVGIHEA
jgi:hypothetical protein